MIDLFSEARIGELELKNHFFRSATGEVKATSEGHLTEELFTIYRKLSEGGIGAIITGFAFIHREEQPEPNMMGIYDDSFIEEYQKLTDMIHEFSVKAIMQLVYGGSSSQGNPTNENVWGPSAIKHPESGITPREMTKSDIESVVQYFAHAADRAKKSGFDGVQIHGAHGYLLSQFLSPLFNHRNDEYGGSLENRARLTLDVYSGIREKVGDDFPILIKINSSDDVEGGLSFNESLLVSERLCKMGIDAIEVSGGNPERSISTIETESYFKDYAMELSEIVETPIILTGGNRSISLIQQIADNSNVKYFGFARPLLRDPEFIHKLKRQNR